MENKKYLKVRDHCHYTGEYRGAAHGIYNLKYIVPKNIPTVFHSGSNYGYHFMIKESLEKFKKQFAWLGENTEKYIIFAVLIEKKLQELIEMEKKLQNIYFTYYNLLIAQDLWQTHYQILSIVKGNSQS